MLDLFESKLSASYVKAFLAVAKNEGVNHYTVSAASVTDR
jgi:hypothetical protein